MTTVREHYRSHLAPICLWMAGGASVALSTGESDIRDFRGPPGLAVDLGAGFGMHSIPLARAGYRVVAIDTSELLLTELSALAGELSIDIHCGDLLSFPDFLPLGLNPQLILCMGDTLTHVEDLDAVRRLAQTVAENLETGGRFVATFRDYTTLPGARRASYLCAATTIASSRASLEEHPEHVQVHDIVQTIGSIHR